MNTSQYWETAIPVPLRRNFIYEIPNALGIPCAGMRVLVPFGSRRMTGYLLREVKINSLPEREYKKVINLLDEKPAVPPSLLEFLEEAAAYYMHPMGEAVRSALPPGIDITEKKGTVKTPRVKVRKIPVAVLLLDNIQGALSAISKRAHTEAAVLEVLAKEKLISFAKLKALCGKSVTVQIKKLEEKGYIRIEERDAEPDPYWKFSVTPDEPPVLTEEQDLSVSRITDRLNRGGYEGFLLHGVTGSGKTEVYFRIIEQAHCAGKGALVLVPEIALTPQLTDRYRRRFGDALAVWHSALSEKDRYEQWQALRTGTVRVAIGVRSAVFAPVQNLGVIIVDEEHDSSFKQERGFRYNARDLALLRAARSGAVAVLGSATPSLESLENASRGKLTKLMLINRATNQQMPKVNIIDRTLHRNGPGNQNMISKPMYDAITERLSKKEQIILFLNRRGFAQAILCPDCGTLIKCDFCAVSMTYHKRPEKLICHYCGSNKPLPRECPSCSSKAVEQVGTGTQQVEDVLASLFPSARIARLDRDTGAGHKAEAVLSKLRNQEIDILVGTQMVTKGHDFPMVTLVGVLNADVGLHMPDFRASERTFQLLTQVAGRAGRGKLSGLGLIQTYHPKHPAVVFAKNHDYNSFAAGELISRRELGYPPFGRLALLRFSGPEIEVVETKTRSIFSELNRIIAQNKYRDLTLLGPVPAPMPFVQNKYHFRILIKALRQDQIRHLLEPLIPNIEAPGKGVRIAVDIDPFSML